MPTEQSSEEYTRWTRDDILDGLHAYLLAYKESGEARPLSSHILALIRAAEHAAAEAMREAIKRDLGVAFMTIGLPKPAEIIEIIDGTFLRPPAAIYAARRPLPLPGEGDGGDDA